MSWSALSGALRIHLSELEAARHPRRVSTATAAALVAALDELPPESIVRAAAGIAKPGGLFYGYVPQVVPGR